MESQITAANMPRFRANDIDFIIKSISLIGNNTKSSFIILKKFFGATVSSRCIKERISNSQVYTKYTILGKLFQAILKTIP